ncbi:hypothetical protein ACH5RR_005706 [Cinchona calisaya]|uniref:Pentatricopeptide repeat-containing protein n=1 Tax=Cinchona calisaya TaxID=153742 RepID=A0ABD3ALY6_9GENT
MPHRNLTTFSTTINALYKQYEFYEEALTVFLEFRRSCSENLDEFVLAPVIRCCTQLDSSEMGLQLHNFSIRTGLDQHIYVGNCLIEFYRKVVDMEAATLVFDRLLMKSAVTWNSIIIGFVNTGRSEVSLQLFNKMLRTDVIPDKYVISSVLSACVALEFLEGGKQIHAYLFRKETEKNDQVDCVLIDLYVKCGKVETGRTVFDRMLVKDVVSWTTMISGYMQNSFDWEAMELFSDMSRLGCKPEEYACASVLLSCSSVEALEQGRQVHAYSLKSNLDSDGFVRNNLIDVYAKCGSLVDARRIFDTSENVDVIPYNAIIGGYSRQEKLYEALDLFAKMRINFIFPSLATFISLLGVSASLMAFEVSKQIHALMIRYGFCLDIFAGSALIKSLCVGDGRLIFEEMNDKDIIVWNVMLGRYTQQMENEGALKLYQELQLSGLKPNEYTLVALITAASNLASLTHGLQFHNQLIKTGLNFDPYITNALIDMYANCGSLEEARKIFDSASMNTEVACWNSMIMTYAQHGEAEEALNVFKKMIQAGIKPDSVSFVGVLSACSHDGFVDEGFHHFELMSRIGIEPETEHYACMVSLLARAGNLYEAKEFIQKMPIKPAARVWRTLLSACRITGNIEMAEHAAEMTISVDPNDSGSFALLSNIFASQGMWIDVKKVRDKMDRSGVVKEAGCSWIEMNNEVHSFVAKDRTHYAANLIYSVMDHLSRHMRGVVHVPDNASLPIVY